MSLSFDFERVIDRKAGDSIKWNRYAGSDILPNTSTALTVILRLNKAYVLA